MSSVFPVDELDGDAPTPSRPKRVRRAPQLPGNSEFVQDEESSAAAAPAAKKPRGAGATPRSARGGGGEGGGGGGRGAPPSPLGWDPVVGGIIPGGSLGPEGESVYFALNDGYYMEIFRRAEMVVQANIGITWGGLGATTNKHNCDMEAAIEDASRLAWRGLLRRKNAYVWQTRLMIERTSLNAGHFDHPLLAAVAYDFAQTFLRPSLKNANGTAIPLNFSNTASDTRIVPVKPYPGLYPICLERPGVPMEEGHFWTKDEGYYAEIKGRAVALERFGCVPASASGSELAFVGIQRHKRKQQGAPGGAADKEAGATFTWEGKLIYRRKWFYLGRFKTQLEAAVA